MVNDKSTFSSRSDNYVTTALGRVHLKGDDRISVSRMGQFSYFSEYVVCRGLFESCPLRYESSNAPDKVRVLGTLLKWAYALYSHNVDSRRKR